MKIIDLATMNERDKSNAVKFLSFCSLLGVPLVLYAIIGPLSGFERLALILVGVFITLYCAGGSAYVQRNRR